MATSEEPSTDASIICYAPSMITTNGVWQGDNPLDFSLPLFVLQLTLVVVVTRFFVFILKPFRQPRVISEILVSNHKFSIFFIRGGKVFLTQNQLAKSEIIHITSDERFLTF